MRSTPLKRTGFKATTPRRPIPHSQAPKARQRPLRAVSDRRRAGAPERAEVRRAVFERDGGCLLRSDRSVPPCFGGPTPHHLTKASALGGYTMDNLVCLCAFHNDWVETEPLWATALGLVRR